MKFRTSLLGAVALFSVPLALGQLLQPQDTNSRCSQVPGSRSSSNSKNRKEKTGKNSDCLAKLTNEQKEKIKSKAGARTKQKAKQKAKAAPCTALSLCPASHGGAADKKPKQNFPSSEPVLKAQNIISSINRTHEWGYKHHVTLGHLVRITSRI